MQRKPTRRPTPFERWLTRVDRCLYAKSKMGHGDLPDQSWRDWFDDGMTPNEAADEGLDRTGFFDSQDYLDL